MKPRPCQYCGTPYESAHPAKLYCSAKCKNDMGNFFGVVGKRIAADAMLWRIKRGSKGAGSEAFQRLCGLLDEANEEFRSRAPKAPNIAAYVDAAMKAGGIRRGKDR